MPVTLDNDILNNNSATGYGGGIYSSAASAYLTLRNTTVSDNTAAYGAGLFTGNRAILTNAKIRSNSASATGGGLYASATAFLTVTGSAISGNTATRGGGLYFDNGGALDLETSTISGNLATSTADANGGGGLYFFGNTGYFFVENSTISSNIADGSGGGVMLRNFTGTADFFNDTILGNAAYSNDTNQSGSGGGGIAQSSGAGTIVLNSTIVSSNFANNQRSDIADPTGVTATFSAIGQSNGFSLAAASENNASFGADLKLGSFGYHGGQTETMSLLPGSTAIDHGSNQQLESSDERGSPFVRTYGGVTDIGAYEYQPFVVDTISDAADGNYGPGQFSLREALGFANSMDDAQTIIFSPTVFNATPHTITLAGTELAITNNVTIIGPGSDRLFISGNNLSRVFDITNTATITNLSIVGGSSTNGGGIYATVDPLTLDGVSLYNNHASVTGGGLSVAHTSSLITIRNSNVSGNTAPLGGGLYFFSGGGLLLQNTAISGNDATTTANTNGGGGLYFFGTVASGGFTISNSTIAGNTANSGGGIVLRTFVGTANIQSSTITGNTANSTNTSYPGSGGGGIAQNTGSGTIVLASTIVSGNSANNGRSDIANGGPAGVSVTYSAVGANAGFTYAAGSANNLPAGTNLKLGSLGAYASEIAFVTLLTGSPAIDAGFNAANASFDTRGTPFVRTYGGKTDIGAIEEQPATFVVSTSDDVVDGDFSPGHLSLREALNLANTNPGADTILFSPIFNVPQTIMLSGTELPINDSTTITGPGSGLLTINANNKSSVFEVYQYGDGNPSSVTISGLTLTGGSTSETGGGLHIDDGAVTLDHVVITGNHGIFGGGIGVEIAAGMLTIRNSTLANNTADMGGGVYFSENGSLLIENSTLSGNTATDTANGYGGGGVCFFGTVSGGGFTIRNSTIANNKANSGGGVNFSAFSGTAVFQNSTITGNSATSNSYYPYGAGGGGITLNEGTGTIALASTIVSGNHATNNRHDIASANVNTVTMNYSAVGVSFYGYAGGGNNLAFGTALNLGTLGNYGGPVATIPLLAGSPAINAGSNPAGLTYDARGTPYLRVGGPGTDIGAYESQPMSLVVDNTGDTIDGDYSAGHLTLREAIALTNNNAGADAISFSPTVFNTPQTIVLGGTELLVSDSVTITGPGAGLLTVNGNNASRVFEINGPGTLNVTMTGLTVTGGNQSTSFNNSGILDSDEVLTLDGVVITGNSSTYGPGGGLEVTGPSPLVTVRNSTISNNGAPSFGGGISAFGGASLLLLDSTVSGNSTTTVQYSGSGAGGIYFGGAGSLTIRNSTIAGNSTNGDSGGGLTIFGTNGAVLIQNSTITANTASGNASGAGKGGGGFNRFTGTGPFTLTSTIVSGNTAGNAAKDIADASAAGIATTNGAIGVLTGFNLAAGSGNNLVGAALNLGTLANYGGPVATIPLLAGSPAIDAGSNPAGLSIDTRGMPFNRVSGAAVDIGAYERQALTLVVDNVGNVVDGDYSINHLTLPEALGLANANSGVAETITFSPAIFALGQTINLGGTALSVTDAVTIAGPGAGFLIINGDKSSGDFNITAAATITGLTITGGVASVGGGISLAANVPLTLDGVVLTGNTASISSGALRINSPSTALITIHNTTISMNTAQFGGGIFFTNGGGLLLDSSTVNGNLATSISNNNDGGGIAFHGAVAIGGFTVRNSTIANNTAYHGGGVGLTNFTGTAIFQNSTLTGNSAVTTDQVFSGAGGGGISHSTNTGTIVLASTIVAGNTATNGRNDISDTTSAVTGNNSAIGINTGFSFAAGSANNLLQGAALNLGALQDNGGPTLTIALGAGSAAIDAGANPASLTTDQRGLTRTVAAAIDIGAYERQAAPAPVVVSVTINGGAVQRSRVTSIEVTFSNVLDVNPAAAFSLTRLSDGATVGGISASSVVIGGKTVTTLTFGGSNTDIGSLADGKWTLLIQAGAIVSGGTPMAGNYSQGNIKRLFGDVNNDGTVDGTDFANFGNAFGQTVGQFAL